MATTTRNLALATAAAFAIAPFAYRFYRRWSVNREASAWLGAFDKHQATVDDCLEDKASEGGEQPKERVRGWTRKSTGATGKLAQVAADEAYCQFGRRERSQANDLITRKFLRDWLREHKGLRAKDANIIIEVALSLSYVPPLVHPTILAYEQTRSYKERVSPSKSWFC